jgi:acetaldehyde dehydrogenase (acetylating)
VVRDDDLLSVQEARDLVEKAYQAARQFRAFTQEQVDAVIDAMAAAADSAAESLAQEAVQETGYGVVADKVIKNRLSSRGVYQAIRGMKTVGVIREDPQAGILEIAEPVGVVAAVLPTTNPTSTAIYKILISLKGRNAIVLSPHPNAFKCTCHAAEIMYRAARQAGAPENVIGCMTHPTLPGTQELMKHRRTGVILSTGGTGIVRAAYSSGKPAYGVGPGNVPAMLERSCDVQKAVADVVAGTTFDNGTLCSSEQAIVAEEPLREQVMAELKANHAYLLDDQEASAVARILITSNFTVNPKMVGKAATVIAQAAGVSVPPETRALVAHVAGVGREYPLSSEKLSPVLALYFVKDFADGLDRCESLLRFGGLGHTCSIHSRDDAKIRAYGERMPAFRIVVNSATTHGSVGLTTSLFPAMTLGCGALGGNVTGDNVTPMHLINIKRVAHERVTVASLRSGAPAAPVAVSALPPVASSTVLTPDKLTVEKLVHEFMARKGVQPEAAAPVPSPAPETRHPAPAAPAAPPAPAPTVVDFVSENDVRAAVNKKEKIHIGPRTIITPAARDMAGESGVLVMHHDSSQSKK